MDYLSALVKVLEEQANAYLQQSRLAEHRGELSPAMVRFLTAVDMGGRGFQLGLAFAIDDPTGARAAYAQLVDVARRGTHEGTPQFADAIAAALSDHEWGLLPRDMPVLQRFQALVAQER